ncbi:ATP-binding protein [bacterium]
MMDRELLKEVIINQNEQRFYKDLGIERKNLTIIERYLKLPQTIIISGIRRAGKSTFLAQIANKYYDRNVYYINFEDERLIDFSINDFNLLHELFIELLGHKKVFCFDEIQNIKKWELFVRRMYDDGYKFFITGSNASLLSKELSTRLTGRNIVIELYPFSFKEFLTFHNVSITNNSFYITKEKASIRKYFDMYLAKGGMPEYLKYNEEDMIKKVYEDILYRDIVSRYDIKDVKALRELAFYLLSNIGSEYSYNRLKNIVGLKSENTVKNYIHYLENSFLFFTLNKFTYSLKNQYFSQKKIYCIDNGITESIAFKFSENRGKYLENLVFLELKKRYEEIYYYKTANKYEVDFITRDKYRKIFLFQVAQKISQQETRQREIRSLVEAMNELNLNQAVILTEDNEEQLNINGKKISILSVYKWLLV